MTQSKHIIQNTHCRRCALWKSSVHVCVMGRGDACAPIMLIGEAPGEAEARTGLPFMGKAGRLLNRLLDELNMSNLVYITNAVKCRPPENRRPNPLEIEACHTYLQQEIALIKPKIIILLGRTSISACGWGHEVHAGSRPFVSLIVEGEKSCWFKASWHPAYCIRRGQGATNDLRKTLKWAKKTVTKGMKNVSVK